MGQLPKVSQPYQHEKETMYDKQCLGLHFNKAFTQNTAVKERANSGFGGPLN